MEKEYQDLEAQMDFYSTMPAQKQELIVVPDFDMQASRITTPMGLPVDPMLNVVPGLESTIYAQPSASIFNSIESVWDSIYNASESVVGGVYGTAKDLTTKVYGDIKAGVGTVVDDVTEPLSANIKSVYWYMILGVVVVGGIIYFAGKSGAVRANVRL